MDRWIGRVALVTGASSGLGEAIAKRLVTQGMKVAGCARNMEKLKALEISLQQEKGSFMPIQCDVSKEDQIFNMFTTIKETYGGIDVCVNNAGLSHNAPLLTGKTEDWRHMLEVNVLGVCICTREAVNSMKERNVDDGHIILIGSTTGYTVINSPDIHMYAATKFATRAITEGLRNELVGMKSHIRVTAISPGVAKTDFFNRMFKDSPELAQERLSGYEPLTPGDVADMVVYALSAPQRVQIHDVLIRPTDCPF